LRIDEALLRFHAFQILERDARMKSSQKLLSLLILSSLLLLTSACTQLFRAQEKPKPQDKGGIELLMLVKADKAQLNQAIEQTMAVIQKRCDQLNIYCKLQRQYSDQIKLRFSSEMESSRVKNILVAEGLEVRAVVSPLSPSPLQTYRSQAEAAAAAGTDKDVLVYDEGEGSKSFVITERTPIVTGQDVRSAEAVPSTADSKSYAITFQLKPEGAARFSEWTGTHINNYLAIIMNKQVKSVAYIKSQISDSGEISGNYTKQEAEDVANILLSGNLPAPVELLEEKTYRP
jgi:preprotein translocase subunit SecD